MDAIFFNTAGPIQPDTHYNIDPLKRVDTDEIMMLVRQRKYRDKGATWEEKIWHRTEIYGGYEIMVWGM